MVLKLKISYNGDLRRVAVMPRDFATLQVKAFETHEIPENARENLVLKYIDDEGELITLLSTRDFEEALELAREEKRKSLKITILDKKQVAADHAAVGPFGSYASESVATMSVAGGLGGAPQAPPSFVSSPPIAGSYPPPAPAAAPSAVAPVARAAEEAPKETAVEEPLKQEPEGVVAKEPVNEEPVKEETAAEEPKEENKDKQKKCKKNKRCGRGLRKKIIDFVSEAAVQRELTEAVPVFFAALREHSAKPGVSAKDAVLKASDFVFDTFEALGKHPLVEQVRKHLVPRIAEMGDLLVSIDEEMMKRMVEMMKDVMEKLFQCVNEHGDKMKRMKHLELMHFLAKTVCPDMSSVQFLPMMFGLGGGAGAFPGAGGLFGMFNGGGGDGQDEDAGDEETAESRPTHNEDGKTIHYGVECDVCKMCPIVGDRYKCYTCADYDMCATCEAKPNLDSFVGTGHRLEHITIKYKTPRSSVDEAGARRGGRRGGRCGRRGGGRFGGGRHNHRNRFGGNRHGHGGPGGWWRGGGGAGNDAANNRFAGQQPGPNPFDPAQFQAFMRAFVPGMGAQQQQGAGANAFDPAAMQSMMMNMMGGNPGMGMGGGGGGRCGGRRGGGPWGPRGGKRGQRGPYNAEVTTELKKATVSLEGSSVSFKVKNTGDVAWPEGSRAAWQRGHRVGPTEVPLPVANPGESVTVTVPISGDALAVGESYHGVYRLKLPNTVPAPRKFGTPLTVRIKVAAKEAEAEVAEKPRRGSALSPPSAVADEAEESKSYTPPEAKPIAEPAPQGKLEPIAPKKEEPVAAVAQEPVAAVAQEPVAVVAQDPVAVVAQEPVAAVAQGIDNQAPLIPPQYEQHAVRIEEIFPEQNGDFVRLLLKQHNFNMQETIESMFQIINQSK